MRSPARRVNRVELGVNKLSGEVNRVQSRANVDQVSGEISKFYKRKSRFQWLVLERDAQDNGQVVRDLRGIVVELGQKIGDEHVGAIRRS